MTADVPRGKSRCRPRVLIPGTRRGHQSTSRRTGHGGVWDSPQPTSECMGPYTGQLTRPVHDALDVSSTTTGAGDQSPWESASTRAGTSDHGMCRQLKLYAFVLQLRVAPGRLVQLWLGVGSSSHSTLWRRCSSPGLPQTTDHLGKILTQPRATLLAIWGTGILGIDPK